MSRYVPAGSRPPASPEYVAVPGYMGNYGALPPLTKTQKIAAAAAVGLGLWWFMKKKKK